MKIITGTAKGMILETLEGEATRPTSQRVKEAVFSMLQFDIESACVLDLFAGSGQLGLEALSRGAKKAVFCDASRDATDIIIKNAKKAKLFDKCRVSTCDYNQMLGGVAGKEKFDIVFIDPPYSMKITSKILNKLYDLDLLNEGAFVVCECGDDDCFNGDSSLDEKYEVHKKSRYSVSYITVLRPKWSE